MAILSRIFRICKADLHGVMDQIEDHGLLLKQYLREMENSLEEKESRLATVEQACNRIQKDIFLRKTGIDKIDKDIDRAVRRDRDDIARMLIHKRITLESVCERMGDRMETLAMEKQTLLETLERQRLQYEECKTRAVVFCSRSGERPTESAGGPTCDAIGLPETTEEEVELELMQRKESLQQGGAA